MSEPATVRYLSIEEYLELEGRSDIRHEYVHGRTFGMTGATEAHNLICGNLYVALHTFLTGTGCRVFQNDMKVRVDAADSFYYPDIMVTCEPYDASSVFKSAPTLIVEVLSPSTKQIDRREKLVAYQQLDNLTQYALVHQKTMLVELYTRFSTTGWEYSSLKRSDIWEVGVCPGKVSTLELSVEAIYRDIDLSPFVKESEEEYRVDLLGDS